jgi:hypothetical protein
LVDRQSGRERTNDDRIIARQDEIDHQHLDEGRKRSGLSQIGEVPHNGFEYVARTAKPGMRRAGSKD